MKTIKLFMHALFLVVLSAGMLSAQETTGAIITSTGITVKHGHHAQFIEGVKKWKECYLENNGERTWSMWHRLQGEGNYYVMNSTMVNWAVMDESDPVNKECYSTLLNFIMPHVEKVNFSISQNIPEFSRSWPTDGNLANVTFYRVNNPNAFKEILSAVSASVIAKEGSSRGIWREYKGGSVDDPHFMVAIPYRNFADLDITRVHPATIYTEAEGEEKANKLREKWFNTVVHSWSYIYTLNTDLSNN